MDQPNEIFGLLLFSTCIILNNSFFGLLASKIFEAKGRSKTIGFWLGFFGLIPGVVLAIILPPLYYSPIQSVAQSSRQTYVKSAVYNDNHDREHEGKGYYDEQLDEVEWKEKLKDQDRKFNEEYDERKRLAEEKADAYWEAQEQKKQEEDEYWEEKRQEENERMMEEWKADLRRRAGYDE